MAPVFYKLTMKMLGMLFTLMFYVEHFSFSTGWQYLEQYLERLAFQI